MQYLLDGAICALFLILIWIGHKRGAIRTLIELVSGLASLIGAVWLGNVLSDWIYTTFLQKKLAESVAKSITESVGAPISDRVASVSEKLPSYVESFFNPATLSASIQSAVESGAESGARTIVEWIIRPILLLMMRAVLGVILFIALFIAFRLIARGADLVAKLPVLHQMNEALGSVCGAAKGILIILLVAALVRVGVSVKPNGLITEEQLHNTVVLNWVCEHNPVYDFFAPDSGKDGNLK